MTLKGQQNLPTSLDRFNELENGEFRLGLSNASTSRASNGFLGLTVTAE
jgi:hypothetical protein